MYNWFERFMNHSGREIKEEPPHQSGNRRDAVVRRTPVTRSATSVAERLCA